MTDKELLDLAAKSIGYRIKRESSENCMIVWNESDDCFCWNPLTDDSDALRLAVKLRIDVLQRDDRCMARESLSLREACVENFEIDEYAATRRAIVRAAAEVGKAMP